MNDFNIIYSLELNFDSNFCIVIEIHKRKAFSMFIENLSFFHLSRSKKLILDEF